jgi:DNA polymerase I
LSAETIRCTCCTSPDGSTLKVPELGYSICKRRIGIVPVSLKILLEKRSKYKRLLKSCNETNLQLKETFDARQTALKWVLVTSFGYLGFNNAKFGRIDAHIAVCAFDRKILLDTAKMVEQNGFRVLHGIVDSVWLQKRNKYRAEPNEQGEYIKLKELIELQTGFKVSFEGIYKWIVFVHSKIDDTLPVPNRYFGVFEDGSLKIRGIEARRHDTPQLFSKCQNEILEIMANGNTINEVKALMPKVKDIFYNYVHLLYQRRVPFEELVFTKRLSKNSNEYEQNRNTVENNSIQQLLEKEGKSIKAGEILKYVITSDYYRKQSKRRAVPIELINDKTTYNVRRYTELLAEVCNSVTEPFGYSFDLDLSLPN